MDTRRPVDRKIRLLALDHTRLLDMIDLELKELGKLGKSVKTVTTNRMGVGYTAEVVYVG